MLEAFSYAFMQRALVAGAIVAVIAPLLGSFLMVRRFSLIADTLSHASLAGVAIGALLGLQPVLAAALVAGIVALSLEWLRASGRFPGDALLAMFLSGSLALAVVVMSATGNYNAGLLGYLFGSITTISSTDLWTTGALGVVVFAVVVVFYRRLFLMAFDEDVAKAAGLNVRGINMLMAVLTAATVSVSMRVVGVLLIGALMVIPMLAAIQLGRGFRATMMIAVAVSVVSVAVGLFASYALDIAAGGAIVLCSVAFFVMFAIMRRVL